MTVEPISSVMTYQAQTTPQARPAATAVESTEAIPQEVTNSFDPTTVKVAETQPEDSNAGQDSAGNSAAQQNQQAQNEKIKKAVEQMNKNMNNSEAIFGIHEGTNRVTIKIVDKDTKEVIKEVPAEKTLDMIAKAWELAGLMVDEKR